MHYVLKIKDDMIANVLFNLSMIISTLEISSPLKAFLQTCVHMMILNAVF